MLVCRCSWEISGRKLHEKSKKSQALRITILWEFDEKHPRLVSACGTQPWAKFSRPRSKSSGQALRDSIYNRSHSDSLAPQVWVSFEVYGKAMVRLRPFTNVRPLRTSCHRITY